MSIVQIGRVFDTYDVDVGDAKWSGDSVTLSGEVVLPAESNRVDIAKAMRDRILSLVNNRDEVDVAVRWTEDTTVNGFYRPTAASADFTVASLNDGVLPWSVELRRAGGGTTPQVEVYGLHVVRANQASISSSTLNGGSAQPMVGFPNVAFDAWAGAYVLIPTTRQSASGGLIIGAVNKTFPAQFATTWSLSPLGHYVGACEIRGTYGSATSQLIGGRWSAAAWSTVTLSNGLIRVSNSSGDLYIEVYDGSQWEPLHAGTTRWQIESDWAGGTKTWSFLNAGMQILRNSPEQCTVRLFTDDALSQATWGRVWLDLTVQRGKRHISAVIQSDSPANPASNVFAIKPSASIANSAVISGAAWRATSNDAQGNRAVWGAAGVSTLTGNTTTGRVVQASSPTTQMPFFIGVEVSGTSATGNNAALQVAYQWFDIASETQRIVRR